MKLENRLKVLEQREETVRKSYEDAGEQFMEELFRKADRLQDVVPNEEWLRKASIIMILAKGIAEHYTGASTPILWARIEELTRTAPPPAHKLFVNLMAMHGGD